MWFKFDDEKREATPLIEMNRLIQLQMEGSVG